MGIWCEIFGIDEAEIIRLEGEEDALMEFYRTAKDKINLGKCWIDIHATLSCFTAERNSALNFILRGGRPIPGSDTGYGMAEYFPPSEVAAINSALSILDPLTWDDEILAGILTSLRRFVTSLSSREKGMLIWFT